MKARPERPDDLDHCAACGRAITQPPTGRRRRYCSPRCQKRGARLRRRQALGYVLPRDDAASEDLTWRPWPGEP